MLYKTKHGNIMDEHELNELSLHDIEEQGIHAADHWAGWHDEEA